MASKRTVLLVEDEESITAPLAEALSREGFEPVIAGTAAEALELAASRSPDLVLLDLMLPDGSGLEVCRELRSRSAVPIIMVTARGEEMDRVVGLEVGADDYVVKPFSAREVIARIRAVLCRTAAAPAAAPAEVVELGDVRVDRARRSASLAGEPLELSRKEFDLLHLLVDSAGNVVTRGRLIDEVWDTNWFGSTKTLDVHVSALRKKLSCAKAPGTSSRSPSSGWCWPWRSAPSPTRSRAARVALPATTLEQARNERLAPAQAKRAKPVAKPKKKAKAKAPYDHGVDLDDDRPHHDLRRRRLGPWQGPRARVG